MTDLETVRARAREYADAVRILRSARGELRAAIIAADHARGGDGRNELARAAEPYKRPQVFEAIDQQDVYSRAVEALRGLDTDALILSHGPRGSVRLELDMGHELGWLPAANLAGDACHALRENGLRAYMDGIMDHDVHTTMADGGVAEITWR